MSKEVLVASAHHCGWDSRARGRVRCWTGCGFRNQWDSRARGRVRCWSSALAECDSGDVFGRATAGACQRYDGRTGGHEDRLTRGPPVRVGPVRSRHGRDPGDDLHIHRLR